MQKTASIQDLQFQIQSPPLDSWTSLIGRYSIVQPKSSSPSCDETKTKDEEEDAVDVVDKYSYRDLSCHKIDRRVKNEEVPPTIPWLARTGNLPSHMPWVLKRYYTADGRLVIREEKVKQHHECFRAYRSDGRLRLQLVPMDNVDDDYDNDVFDFDDDFDNDDENACNGDEKQEQDDEGKMVIIGKCNELSSSGSCLLGVETTFRPVQI